MRLTPDVAEYLSQQLDTLQAERAKLEHELSQLASRKEQVDDDIAAVERILASGGTTASPPAERPRSTVPPGNGGRQEATVTVDSGPPHAAPPGSHTGLRDAIRSVLEERGKGMRPIEVARRLQEAGFRSATAKTELATRVGNEMWRMGRSGQLTKRGHSYSIARPRDPA